MNIGFYQELCGQVLSEYFGGKQECSFGGWQGAVGSGRVRGSLSEGGKGSQESFSLSCNVDDDYGPPNPPTHVRYVVMCQASRREPMCLTPHHTCCWLRPGYIGSEKGHRAGQSTR